MPKKEKNFKALAELFKPHFLRCLANDNYSSLLHETFYAYGGIREFTRIKRLPSLFQKAYNILSSNCAYEYVFKTTILNNIFLKYHDFDSAYYTTEFFCKKSKADIAIFNGYASAYEIKTKFDNLGKLEKQLLDYKTVFNKIYVVADKKHILNIEKIVDKNTGILLLEDGGQISEIRSATVDFSMIDKSALFDCLHKAEYKKVIHHALGATIDIPNALEYSRYKQLFLEFTLDEALQTVIEQLRFRALPLSKTTLLKNAPPCLFQAILDSNLTTSMCKSIVSIMDRPFILA